MRLTLSPEDRNQKPVNPSRENGLINQSNTVELSVEEFVKFTVAPYGRTWCGAVLKGDRKTSNFVSSQIIALDIDNKLGDTESILSVEEVLNRCHENGIFPAFIYSSFSHTEQVPRFRIVFILDKVIDSHEAIKSFTEIIRINIFPKADTVTDAVRMWYGGKSILYQKTDSVVSVEKIKEIDYLSNIPKSGRNIKRSISKVDDRWCKIEKALYNSNEKSQNCTSYPSNKLDKFDWEYAKKECSLLRKLLDGTEKVWHNDLLILASNMFRIKGGEKLFKNAVLDHPLIADEKIKLISYVKNRWDSDDPIFPISFKLMYSEDIDDKQIIWKYKNLLHVRPPHQFSKAMRIEENQPLISPEEARETMSIEFNRILNNSTNDIYLIKCVTGLGKTSLAINRERIALFFPTHALKDEKSSESEIDHICSPQLPDFSSNGINLKEKYKNLCNCGMYQLANRTLRDFMIKHKETYPIIASDIEKYLSNLKDSNQSDKTIFSTHAKGINVNYKNHDTYVFDEDPFQKIVQFEKITTKDLRLIGNELMRRNNNVDAKKILDLEKLIKVGIDFFGSDIMPGIIHNADSVQSVINSLNRKLSGNIASFLFNKYPIKYIVNPIDYGDPEGEKNIHYVNYRPLREDKKYIILSATVDEWMYKKLYGDRVKVIELSNVEDKGIKIQFSDKSFSRTAMKNQYRVDIVNGFLPECSAISFLSLRDRIVNAHEGMHFGKSEGFNSLSGQNIKVVGTPHVPKDIYLLMAKFLEIPINSYDLELQRMPVEHNGYRFNFNTFVSPNLRRIQFYFIESQLIQAIGRARLINHDCIVFLFSEFPVPNAEQFYLKEVDFVKNEYLKKAS